MLNISKSQYISYCQCPKMLWLRKHRPDLIPEDTSNERTIIGNEVGELAKGLFGDFTDVTVKKSDKPDLAAMIERTKEEIEKGTNVICEAAFNSDGLYCAVDILKKNGDGYEIYEVKSSSDPEKDVYLIDIAYQKYVLTKIGINVKGTYSVVINKEYVRYGDLDISQFFKITDVSDAIEKEYEKIPQYLSEAEQLVAETKEPQIRINEQCFKPYDCIFWPYCAKDVPEQSVFDLYRIHKSTAFKYYYQGIVSFEDAHERLKLKKTQKRQVDFAVEDKGTYVDKDGIREYLKQLTYPIYFLDFETMQTTIPLFDGTKPNQQIAFQYSLHYIESEDGELKHKEFLAESGKNPLRPIAEALCRDIPMNVSVTAYNKKFECGRLEEMAGLFPDLSEHLLNIRDHIVDLLDPFQGGLYYNRAMGGSFSIKSVLPAIYPDDPELDYHNLDQIHNGGEAMTIFPQIQYMDPEEQEITRSNLLKYCGLDTYAMVKVWEELVRVSK